MKQVILTIIFSGFLSLTAHAQVAALDGASNETLVFQRKQIQALTAKVNTLQADILRMQSEGAQAGTSRDVYESQIRDLTARNEELERALLSAAEKASALSTEQKSALKSSAAEIKTLTDKVESLSSRVAELLSRNSEYDKQLKEMAAAEGKFKARIGELEGQLGNTQSRLSARESELKETSSQSESRQTRIKELETQQSEAAKQSKESQNMIQRLQSDLEKQTAKTIAAEQSVQELQKRNKELESHVSIAQKNMKDLEGDLKRASDDRNKTEARYKGELLSAFEENKKTRDQLQAKIDTLNAKVEQQKSMAEELVKLKGELTDAKKMIMSKDAQYQSLLERHNETQAKADTLTVRNEMNALADTKRAQNMEFLKAQIGAAQMSVKKFKYDFGAYLESMIHGMQARLEKSRAIKSPDLIRGEWQGNIAEVRDFQSNFNVSLESLLANLETSGADSQ